MKAMAARPAAPKEATSLAPAPVNGLTGLDGVATALLDGAAHELQLEADELVEAEELELLELVVAEAQSDQVAAEVVVEVAGLVVLLLEEEEAEDQADQVAAVLVVLVEVVLVEEEAED